MDSRSTIEARILDCSDAFSLSEGEGLGYHSRALRVACPELKYDHRALALGEVTPSEPIEHVVFSGRWPRDYIGTTFTAITLLSDRVFDLLTEHGFTGWATYPVKITLKDGSELGGYRGLAVTGRSGPIDDELGEEIIVPPKAPGGEPSRGLRGCCFDPESWDGSDVFCPMNTGFVVVTEAVKKVLESASVTNIAFKKMSELTHSWPKGREYHLPLE